jgi:gamma-glutamylcyclotransferase (GGCT)/AIG2-like uncharacterized protein YtfP
VYGSLVRPGVLNSVIGRPHEGERLRARILDYQRIVSPLYDYPFVVPQAGAVTEGVLIMDLTEPDFRALDEYEDVEQSVYERVSVDVSCLGCGPTEMLASASLYVAGPALLAQVGDDQAGPAPQSRSPHVDP